MLFLHQVEKKKKIYVNFAVFKFADYQLKVFRCLLLHFKDGFGWSLLVTVSMPQFLSEFHISTRTANTCCNVRIFFYWLAKFFEKRNYQIGAKKEGKWRRRKNGWEGDYGTDYFSCFIHCKSTTFNNSKILKK